jgi:hypothetical protein
MTLLQDNLSVTTRMPAAQESASGPLQESIANLLSDF